MSNSWPDGERISPRARALMGRIRRVNQPEVVVSTTEDDHQQIPVLVPWGFVRRSPQSRVVVIVVEDDGEPPISVKE